LSHFTFQYSNRQNRTFHANIFRTKRTLICTEGGAVTIAHPDIRNEKQVYAISNSHIEHRVFSETLSIKIVAITFKQQHSTGYTSSAFIISGYTTAIFPIFLIGCLSSYCCIVSGTFLMLVPYRNYGKNSISNDISVLQTPRHS
jgi:hypothetical protein